MWSSSAAPYPMQCENALNFSRICRVTGKKSHIYIYIYVCVCVKKTTWNKWWLGPISPYLTIFHPRLMVVQCFSYCFFAWNAWSFFLMSQLSAPWELPALRNNKIANTYFAWAVAICCRNLLSLHRRRHEGRRLILVAGLFGSGCVFQRGILRTKPGSRCTAMRKGCVYRVGPCSVLEEKWRTAPRYIYIYIDLTATSLEYFFLAYMLVYSVYHVRKGPYLLVVEFISSIRNGWKRHQEKRHGFQRRPADGQRAEGKGSRFGVLVAGWGRGWWS